MRTNRNILKVVYNLVKLALETYKFLITYEILNMKSLSDLKSFIEVMFATTRMSIDFKDPNVNLICELILNFESQYP